MSSRRERPDPPNPFCFSRGHAKACYLDEADAWADVAMYGDVNAKVYGCTRHTAALVVFHIGHGEKSDAQERKRNPPLTKKQLAKKARRLEHEALVAAKKERTAKVAAARAQSAVDNETPQG